MTQNTEASDCGTLFMMKMYTKVDGKDSIWISNKCPLTRFVGENGWYLVLPILFALIKQ